MFKNNNHISSICWSINFGRGYHKLIWQLFNESIIYFPQIKQLHQDNPTINIFRDLFLDQYILGPSLQTWFEIQGQ